MAAWLYVTLYVAVPDFLLVGPSNLPPLSLFSLGLMFKWIFFTPPSLSIAFSSLLI